MNRQERRKRDREIDKDMNLIKKLPEREVIKINEIIEKVTKTKTEQVMKIIDRSMSAILVSRGWTFKEIREMQGELEEFMREDAESIKILEKGNIDMAKLQAEVKEFIEGLMKSGKGRKEVVEGTMFKFPKLSKTAVNNAYGKILEELEIENAAAYILEDNRNIKKAIEKEDAKKIAAEVARQLEKEISIENRITDVVKKAEAKESDGLEVLEEVVIKEVKLKGKNGVYEAKTGLGVALESEGYKLAFRNIEELESFCNEFKKVFERI
ncbi:hypothetical protein [Clostridium tertium]|uniref:hypothetical protein n=1 Tax=Clostridium tertium TaxID=1559 RepID=UPI001AE2DF66|nr:hypothetical protein [Clostridium tertium]MBP1868987.1 hypothetical protein [Clostridium tertium]